jgi:hypothetical protein
MRLAPSFRPMHERAETKAFAAMAAGAIETGHPVQRTGTQPPREKPRYPIWQRKAALSVELAAFARAKREAKRKGPA